MKWSVVLLTCLVLLAGSISAAADEELTSVIATLETPFRAATPRSQQIRDFTADFVQLSTVVAIDRVQRGEGKVWFKFPPQARTGSTMPMFRWDYQMPNEQQVLSDGTTLWVYVPENRQVIVSEISQVEAEYGDNPAAFFTGLGDLTQNFDIAWGKGRQDQAGHYLLLLTPKRPSQFFKQIEVTVNHQAVLAFQQGTVFRLFPLVATQVTDPQDNLTRITFVAVRWNLDPSDSEFIFEVPAGVEQLSPSAQMPRF
ncbi:MAG: outer membrane lipoprotein carrier protein LolA [Desulfuromonadales bacterium]|nr:outer membrane lipoprotein carrier protein LolA [Desulfuromonadales bacterium]